MELQPLEWAGCEKMVGQSEPSGYVLKFISGKYQGGEFQLEKNKELIIGRSSELEMVLVEDMVSRHHAKITTTDDEVWIEDAGSTNGTFVNGEKITKVRLKEGDRILVGTSIIKLVFEESASYDRRSDSGQAMFNKHGGSGVGQQQRAQRSVPPTHHTQAGASLGVLSGMIDQVPLPDLLQLFGSSKKSGCLIINSNDAEGRVYLKEGRVYAAVVDGQANVSMEKSFYRMMAWTTGTFLLDTSIEEHFENAINESVESLMMEGMRILDEIHNIGPDVPEMTAQLRLPVPLVPPLRNLTPELLDTLQLVHNYRRVETVLNKSLATDLETLQDVVYLMRNDYLVEDQ